jgi:hypothetical protein
MASYACRAGVRGDAALGPWSAAPDAFERIGAEERELVAKMGKDRGRVRLIGAVVAVALTAGLTDGCGGEPAAGSGGQPAAGAARAGDPRSLRGVCPETVVVQSSWFPEVEHAVAYQLVGAGYRFDAKHKRLTGPLVAGGVDTGVRIQIRAGGPAIGFQKVSAQMYADPSITLGMVNSDEVIQQSATAAVLAVLAPLELDPQIILWDPAAHRDFNTINDIGQTDTKVLYYQGSPFMDYLLGSGILRASQVDGAYDGSPARFVASGGRIAVQGYATNEPYLFEHEVRQWRRPVRYALINDTGYPNYANMLTIRVRDRDRLSGCLAKLVPILQRAQVDFIERPEPTVQLILATVNAFRGGFFYSRALADYAVGVMTREGIVGNGGNHTLGDVDSARITRLLNILTPILASQRKPAKAGVRVEDLVTNAYIDPTIALAER